jgi:hypothetical protein
VNYWKVIVATAVIFGAGVFTGGLLVNYVHQTYLRAAAPHHPPATNAVVNPPGVAHLPEPLSKPFLPRLDEMLHLSTDQHKAIEKILTDAQGQMHKVTQDTKLAIRAELTPEQRSQYDEAMKRPGKRPAGTNAVVNVPVTNAGPIVLPAHSAATN